MIATEPDLLEFRARVARRLGLWFDDHRRDFLGGILRERTAASPGDPAAYLQRLDDPASRIERQFVGDRGQLLRRGDHRLCVRLELDVDGWVTRLRQFFGIDDVDVSFDEDLGKLAVVLLRVGATRIRPLDHHAGVVDRQAVDDIGIGAGEDPIGARHYFRRSESPFVDQPSMDLGRLQELLARRRGDANQFQELIPSSLGGRIRALLLE